MYVFLVGTKLKRTQSYSSFDKGPSSYKDYVNNYLWIHSQSKIACWSLICDFKTTNTAKFFTMTANRTNLKVTIGLVTTSIVGFMLSYYTFVVETSKEKDESYEAMCDISERISCTKVFMSEYGKGFGIIPQDSVLYLPNCIYGLITYPLLAVLSSLNCHKATLVLITFGIISNILSVYLAYILYLLSDVCVVCISIYIINAIFLILAIKKYKTFQSETSVKKIQ